MIIEKCSLNNNLKYINFCLAHDAILSFYACLVHLDFKRLK